MFNFLASKYRLPPEYNPQEEDEEEQFRSARSVFTSTIPHLHVSAFVYSAANNIPFIFLADGEPAQTRL